MPAAQVLFPTDIHSSQFCDCIAAIHLCSPLGRRHHAPAAQASACFLARGRPPQRVGGRHSCLRGNKHAKAQLFGFIHVCKYAHMSVFGGKGRPPQSIRQFAHPVQNPDRRKPESFGRGFQKLRRFVNCFSF